MNQPTHIQLGIGYSIDCALQMQLIKSYCFNSYCNEIRDSNHLLEINGL